MKWPFTLFPEHMLLRMRYSNNAPCRESGGGAVLEYYSPIRFQMNTHNYCGLCRCLTVPVVGGGSMEGVCLKWPLLAPVVNIFSCVYIYR